MSKNSGFDFLLGLDFETTGICLNNDDLLYNKSTGERHQAISGGFLIIDAKTYKVIEKLYVEIKWNDESHRQRKQNPDFGKYAENIHGLTLEHLDLHGVEEEEAVTDIANLIIKYWGTSSPLNCLGHNVQFDIRFLKDMFERYDLNLSFSQRNIDSLGIGHAMWGVHNSDELFSLLVGTERGAHNALDDIEMTLESIVTTRTLFHDYLESQGW